MYFTAEQNWWPTFGQRNRMVADFSKHPCRPLFIVHDNTLQIQYTVPKVITHG